jgi:heme O synthase-like polyprenyltransferase
MNKSLVIAAAIAAAALAAFALNPSAERHRDAVKAKIAERSPIAGALGLGALAAFASTYRDYGLASTTEVNGRRLSFGVFGMVFVMQDREQ